MAQNNNQNRRAGSKEKIKEGLKQDWRETKRDAQQARDKTADFFRNMDKK